MTPRQPPRMVSGNPQQQTAPTYPPQQMAPPHLPQQMALVFQDEQNEELPHSFVGGNRHYAPPG